MKWPTLKNPGLCRLMTYVVVLGCGAIPAVAAVLLPLPEGVAAAVFLGSLIGVAIYMIRNFLILMSMDVMLATLACMKTARTQYTLPRGRTVEAIRRSVLRYGMACEPRPIQPQPAALRYRFSSPMTTYSCGIERVMAAYEVELLTAETYRNIFRSAKQNSVALVGRRRAIFLDKTQRKQPLHRVTVLLILAHRVDPALNEKLYDLVCKQCGSEEMDCVVPCVVDLEQRTCVFNCRRIPYVGFSYAVKNRGIRMIKRCVFGGNFNLRGSESLLESVKDYSPEDTLWKVWKMVHQEVVGTSRKNKKRFGMMADREIRLADDLLYLKWGQGGVCLPVELDEQEKRIKVTLITKWTYPKVQLIAKKVREKMRAHILDYCVQRGYAVEFVEEQTLTHKS